MSSSRKFATTAVAVALLLAPAGSALGGGVSADCTRAVQHYGAVQKRLAKAIDNDAPKRKVKRLKRKLRKAERRVERECG
jgi:hypothetical protein